MVSFPLRTLAAGSLPGGLSASYNSTTGVLNITGNAAASVYQGILRQVTYSNSSSNPDPTDREVTFSVGSGLAFDDNGHFYEFITSTGISWTAAKNQAATLNLFGLQGYMVTVTSQEENNFVTSKLAGQGWMGASDAGENKIWRWRTGPEAGTHFFTQNSNGSGCGNGGSVVSGQYANWVPSVPEPNDHPNGCAGKEDYAHFRTNGQWNDFPHQLGSISGYVVEYGGSAGDPSLQLSGTVIVHVVPVNNAPSVTVVNGECHR
jgi:hypothetical protein